MSRYGFLRFMAAVLFSSSLIVADLQFGVVAPLRGGMSLLLEPFRYTADAPSRFFQFVGDYFGARSNLLEEKKQLERQLLEQSVRIHSLDFFVRQNDELRDILALKKRIPGRWVSADVRQETSQLQQDRIYLNLGVGDGVLPGMTVVDDEGVVGQIVRSDAVSSAVNLLSNRGQWIATRVLRTGQLAIVRGAGGVDMEIYSMPGNSDLLPGDKLIADGGAFPPGYPVGTIVEISRGVRYLSASIASAASFYRRQALLIYAEDLPLVEEQ